MCVRTYTRATYRNRTRFRSDTTFDEKASRMKSIATQTRSISPPEAKKILSFDHHRLRGYICIVQIPEGRKREGETKTEKNE